MLHPIAAAIEQWHWGRKREEIAAAAHQLRIVDPEHWLLHELARKLARLDELAAQPPRRTKTRRGSLH